MKGKGLIIVNTGDGKGKTTAALGMAVRAWGEGMRVLIIQFIKGGWKYGELKAIEKLGERIKIVQCGKGFTWSEKADEAEHRRCAQETLELAQKEIVSGNWDMIVLDEINYAVKYGLVDEEQMLALIDKKPAALHLILTGRDAKASLIEKADMVSEIRPVKHHFEKGVAAQKGIEF